MKNLYIFTILMLSLVLIGMIYYQNNSQVGLNEYFPVLSQDARLVSKDAVWGTYTNNRLGFNIDVPKGYYAWNGACGNDNGIAIPTSGLVPLVVFENDTSILFDGGYRADTFAEQLTPSDEYYRVVAHKCKLIPNNSSSVNDPWTFWKFVFGKVNSDQELEQFIQEQYGFGCSLGTQTPSVDQTGVYDIQIEGDGLDLSETKCPVNFVYNVKYFPQQNQVMSVKLGQEGKYFTTDFSDHNYQGPSTFDEAMIQSFRFLEK